MAESEKLEVSSPVHSPVPRDTGCCDKDCCPCTQMCARDSYYYCVTFVKKYKKLIFSLIAGQFLSLLLCGTGSTSEALQQYYSVSAPATQLFFTYLSLSMIFGPMVICRNDFLIVLRKNWWKYLLLGIIDVEGNYLVVLAYKYTNISSVQILDSFTLFTVVVLSYVFLKTRYLIIHLMGVALSVIGIFSLVLIDFDSPHNEAGPNPLLGDLLCLVGAVLYAISNVSQEYLVKNHSILEWLGFLGTVGAVVSGIQVSVLERENLASVHWSWQTCGTFALFVLCLFLFYSLVPIVLKYSNAIVVNLSLLTADVYTIILGKYLFNQRFNFLYIVSFLIVVFGVFIFNLKPLATAEPRNYNRLNKVFHLLPMRKRHASQPKRNGAEDSNLLGDSKRDRVSPSQSVAAGGGQQQQEPPLLPRSDPTDQHSTTRRYSESTYGSNSKRRVKQDQDGDTLLTE